jgi:hypothetical protein
MEKPAAVRVRGDRRGHPEPRVTGAAPQSVVINRQLLQDLTSPSDR